MPATRASHRVVLAVNDAIMVLYGISSVMIGTTLPQMIRSLDLSLARGGLIVSVQNAGGLLALLSAAVIADRISKGRWVIGSFLFLGGVLFVVGFVQSYVHLLAVFFLSGIAIRFLDIMLNAYTGDVAGDSRSRAMNLLHMFFSLGAFAGPLIAGGLLASGVEWRVIYRLVGGFYAIAVIAGVPLYGRYGIESGSRRGDAADCGSADAAGNSGVTAPTASTVRQPAVLILGIVLLLYAVHQTGATAWLPYYLEVDGGFGTASAGAGLSLYWVGIIVSRFVASRLSERLGPKRILVVGALLGGLATGASLLSASVVGFVIAGFLTGATIPLAMILAYELLPTRTGSVTAVLSIFMLAGRLVGPWLIGTIADAVGIGLGMVVVAAALVLAGLAALTVRSPE